MKKIASVLVLTSCVVFGCSKQEAAPQVGGGQPTPVAEKTSEQPKFPNVKSFGGHPPWDLVKDEVIGKVIRSLVPPSQFKCMDDLFNYLPDLELMPDGSVEASTTGASFERMTKAFISASPDGVVHIGLECIGERSSDRMQYFTNSKNVTPPKSVLGWMYGGSTAEYKIVRSDGKNAVEQSRNEFLSKYMPENAPVETNPPASATPQVAAPAPQPAPQPEPAPQPQPQRQVQIQNTDRVRAYADNLADQLGSASHPACGAFASNIRMFGSSGLPDQIRMRQIDALLERVPSFCLR